MDSIKGECISMVAFSTLDVAGNELDGRSLGVLEGSGGTVMTFEPVEGISMVVLRGVTEELGMRGDKTAAVLTVLLMVVVESEEALTRLSLVFVSLSVVLPVAVPVTGRLSCCNPEPSATLVVRIELLAFRFWSIRADFADSNGETGIVVIVFKLLSSLVFCGCWSCAGLGVGLHGWGCEAVLVTEAKEFSTAWCCGSADELTLGIKLDFLKGNNTTT